MLIKLVVASALFVAISHCQSSSAARRSGGRYNFTWPAKRAADMEGDILIGGLMMVHEREDDITCGPIMPQGGIQVGTYNSLNGHYAHT